MAETSIEMLEWQKVFETKSADELMRLVQKAVSEARVDLVVEICQQEKNKESIK